MYILHKLCMFVTAALSFQVILPRPNVLQVFPGDSQVEGPSAVDASPESFFSALSASSSAGCIHILPPLRTTVKRLLKLRVLDQRNHFATSRR